MTSSTTPKSKRRVRTAADARKLTDRQLFWGWSRRLATDPAFFELILEEVDRRAKATDFGRRPEPSRESTGGR
jgi:hypothetical protein